MTESVIVYETVNDVVISSPGAQGPAGRTILNGVGSPSSNLGVTGDFYYNTENTDFYKLANENKIEYIEAVTLVMLSIWNY